MSTRIEIDTKTFIRFWLVIVGFFMLLSLVWQAKTGLILVFISLFLALAMNPLINRFDQLIPGKNRTLPTIISFIIVVVVVGGILAVIVPAVINESTKLVRNMPAAVSQLSDEYSGVVSVAEEYLHIDNLDEQIETNVKNFSTGFVKDFAPNVLNSVSAISDVLAKTVLVLFMTLFMILEGPKVLKKFWLNFDKNSRAMRAKQVIGRMADMVSKYVSGVITVCIIDALVTGLAIFILSLIFKFDSGLTLPFAFITGLGNMIPVFGPIICCVIVAVLMAFNSLPAAIIFTIFVIVYLQIEGNYISPKVQSKRTKLSALVILIAVTVGVYTFGIIGAIVAIPIAGCIKIFLEEYGKLKLSD